MALFKCPECKELVSDTASSCPKCGYIYPYNIGEIRDDQKRKEEKSNRGCTITAVVFTVIVIAMFFFTTNISRKERNDLKSIRGYCDICGRKSYYTQDVIDLCESCYSSFIKFSNGK